MAKLLRRWIFRVAVVLAAIFVTVYGGDSVLFKLRGSPMGKVTVNRYVTIPLKGRKSEFDYLGTLDVPCSVSLFAQSGRNPCWQLRRNPNQGITTSGDVSHVEGTQRCVASHNCHSVSEVRCTAALKTTTAVTTRGAWTVS